MKKMTAERARFLILDALADAHQEFENLSRASVIATFHTDGLASDDETTTWRDVFAAANLRMFANGQARAADHAEFLQEQRANRVGQLHTRDAQELSLSIGLGASALAASGAETDERGEPYADQLPCSMPRCTLRSAHDGKCLRDADDSTMISAKDADEIRAEGKW